MIYNDVSIIGLVADREHIAKAHAAADVLGKGWQYSTQLFEGLPTASYLLAIADDQERIKMGAPVACCLKSVDALYAALSTACSSLDGGGLWLRFVSPEVDERLKEILSAGSRGGVITETRGDGRTEQFINLS